MFKDPRSYFAVCVNVFKLMVLYQAFLDPRAMCYSCLLIFINAPKPGLEPTLLSYRVTSLVTPRTLSGP